jgi:hypothetical protein
LLLALVCLPCIVRAELSFAVSPAPLNAGSLAEAVLTETGCVAGPLPWRVIEAGAARRVEFFPYDYCVGEGTVQTRAHLGVLAPDVERVELAQCSFGPPGVYYCAVQRTFPVLPTLFGDSFDHEVYVLGR